MLFPFQRKQVCISGKLCPISIQVTLSKIYEMVLLNQLENFTDKNNIFAKIKYGFRRRLSCITRLRNVNRLIQNNMNISKLSILVLLDFSKAFDTLDYGCILRKLAKFGFDFNFLELDLFDQ